MGIKQKINVLHLNTATSWRGGENQVLTLVKGLEKYGIKNHLACPADSPLFNKGKEQGFEVLPFNFKSELFLFPLFQLIPIIDKKNIHFVHSHTSHALLYGCLLKMFFPRIKHISTRRVDFHTHKNPVSFLKYHVLTDLIIAISSGIKKVLISDGINPHKIQIVHSGLDFSIFDNTGDSNYLYGELNLDLQDNIIINVASLADHKAQKYLVDAMKIITAIYDNVKLLIVGEGNLFRTLKKQIDDLNLERSIHLLGFRNDIPNLLKISKIFIMSSYLEGLGTSILEGMRMRLPVIATNTGGIPEVVIDNKSGILVPPCNTQMIADAIKKLIDNPSLRQRMGDCGFSITQKYTAEKMVKGNYNIYMKLWRTG